MRIGYATCATALLITTATGLAAFDLATRVLAREQVNALLARRPDLSVATVSPDPWRGRVTLGGVAIRHGRISIAAGSLTLPLRASLMASSWMASSWMASSWMASSWMASSWMASSSWFVSSAAASPFDDKPATDVTTDNPGAVQAPDKGDAVGPHEPAATSPSGAAAGSTENGGGQTATAENVVIAAGQTIYRIKRIDMTGTALTSADLARLVDPNSTEPVMARLKKVDAAAIVVPEILIDDSTAGSERHARIENLLLSGVKGGRIAATSIAGETLSFQDGDDNVNGSIGAIQASDVDLPQIAHVFGSIRSDDSEALAPLFGSATITAFKLSNVNKNMTFTLSTLTETAVRGRPLKSDAILMSRNDAGKRPEAERAQDFQDIAHSFEIGSLDMTDLAISGDGDGGRNSLNLAKVTLKDFAQGKIGGFGLRTFAFSAPKVKLAMATLDAGPFVLPPPKGVDPSAADTMMSGKAKVDIDQIEADISGDRAGGPGSTPLDVKIAHVGIAGDGEPGDLPKTSSLTVDHVTFDLPSAPGKSAALYDMGYRHIDTSMGLVATYDSAAQSLTFHDITLKGVAMGSLALGLQFVNVTKGIASSNPEVVKASALAVLAKRLSLDLVNEGLVDKVIAWKAGLDGLDVDKERASLIDIVENKIPASLNQSANVKILGSAVARFLADPKTLHVGIKSKSGLGVGSMALLSDPALLIDTLDVEASANR